MRRLLVVLLLSVCLPATARAGLGAGAVAYVEGCG
jgi:hypothetical protein